MTRIGGTITQTNYANGGHSTPARLETIPRFAVAASNTLPNNQLQITYLTPDVSLAVANVVTVTGSAQVAATLCRIGVYTVAANGAVTLAASTANDPTLWSAAGAVYITPLTGGPYVMSRGVRYAVGLLAVGTTTAATIKGATVSVGGVLGLDPVMARLATGQTDLPATLATPVSTTSVNYVGLTG